MKLGIFFAFYIFNKCSAFFISYESFLDRILYYLSVSVTLPHKVKTELIMSMIQKMI